MSAKPARTDHTTLAPVKAKVPAVPTAITGVGLLYK
jgi:hypothetical protein